MSLEPERVVVETGDKEQGETIVKTEPELLEAPDYVWPQTGTTDTMCSVKQELIIEVPSYECPGVETKVSVHSNSSESVKKEEEEKEVEAESWGVSEAAAQAELYAGHVVKRELVLGPELLQAPDIAFTLKVSEHSDTTCSVKQQLFVEVPSYECPAFGTEVSVPANSSQLKLEPECVKEEEEEKEVEEMWCGVSEAAAQAGLYAGHVVKQELVLGPELLQAPDIAFALKGSSHRGRYKKLVVRRLARGAVRTYPENPSRTACETPELKRSVDDAPAPAASLVPKRQQARVRGDDRRCSQLISHKNIHGVKKPYMPYGCGICDQQFIQPSDLASHVRTHKIEKPYANNISNEHKRTHTGVNPYECDICKKRFTLSSSLTSHKRIHVDKPYVCNICYEKFTQSCDLIAHKHIHTGEKPYACDICNNQFTTQSGLSAHKRIHMVGQPYECNICQQRFTLSSSLISHKRIHTEGKPYACDICNEQFVCQTDLNGHKRFHTGVLSSDTHTSGTVYTCDICNEQFTHSIDFVSHWRGHLLPLEKPYMCEFCGERYIKLGNLIAHRRIHTGEKPFECDICYKKFAFSASLFSHKCKLHRSTEDNNSTTYRTATHRPAPT